MRFRDIVIGQSASVSKTITETDVVLFAGITGDLNPLHVNQPWAEGSQFGGRIAHGILTAGFVSTVIGMHLPGPGAVYLSQTLRFLRPVRIGDTVSARAEVIELIPARHRMRLKTTVRNQRDETVLDGEALVQLDERDVHETPAPTDT